MDEAGLAAATIFGIALANLSIPGIKELPPRRSRCPRGPRRGGGQGPASSTTRRSAKGTPGRPLRHVRAVELGVEIERPLHLLRGEDATGRHRRGRGGWPAAGEEQGHGARREHEAAAQGQGRARRVVHGGRCSRRVVTEHCAAGGGGGRPSGGAA